MKCLPSVRLLFSPGTSAFAGTNSLLTCAAISAGIATIAVIATISALPAQALALTAKANPSAAAVKVVRVEQGWHLQSAGKSMALPLPPRSRVEHLVSRESGWWLSAVQESAGSADKLHLLRSTPGSTSEGSSDSLGGSSDSLLALPVPAVSADAEILLQPRVLMGDDQLRGLIWLEGKSHNALAVRFARWGDAGWQVPSTVSAVGPGTQIALQTVALADGGWLAAWAAFDGHDDEIAWSRFADGEWSKPATISDNQVPDVTPALFAVPGGALVAWSGFDGRDYRLHVSRFDGKRWSEAALTGGRGTVIPEFSDLEAPVVVFRQAVPRGWVIAELTPDGQPKRLATTPSRLMERPIVSQVGDDGVRIEWLDSEFKTVEIELPWQPGE